MKLTNALIVLESKLNSVNEEITFIQKELDSGEQINGFTLPSMLDIDFLTNAKLPNLTEEKVHYENALSILRNIS